MPDDSGTAHLCEACRRSVALHAVVDDDDPEDPYRLCDACRQRLLARALRPREWLHLSARHGSRYLLHDDFYDDDGTAHAAEEDVVDAAAHPFPGHDECMRSLPLALDVALARWSFPEELTPIFAARKAETLAALEALVRERRNPHLEARAYEIAAHALGPVAADWLRTRWQRQSEDGPLEALAQASAACLPSPEGLERVVAALRTLPPAERLDRVHALAYFRDRRALPFLEEIVVPPTMGGWGRVAACCGFAWPDAVRWLERGRPLSLVALDALRTFLRYDTPLLKELSPTLADPPDADTLARTLREHAQVDTSWRVESDVAFLLEHADRLCGPRNR